MSLDRLWAGWRGEYIASTSDGGDGSDDDGCVFCRILSSGEPDEETHVLWRGDHCIAILNAYPYASGHLMVMPRRHVGQLEDLEDGEAHDLWRAARDGVVALKAAFSPAGVNIGANLGRAAGAGVPGHLHLHVVPRWAGDTNFMTTVAEARVLPEALSTTAAKLRTTWPH